MFLTETMRLLERTNIIKNLHIKGNEFSFTFIGEQKLLVAYYGSNQGDATKFVPPLIKQNGVDVIMVKAFTEASKTKDAILSNLLPYIRPGCFIHNDLRGEIDFEGVGFKKIYPEWWIKPRKFIPGKIIRR